MSLGSLLPELFVFMQTCVFMCVLKNNKQGREGKSNQREKKMRDESEEVLTDGQVTDASRKCDYHARV